MQILSIERVITLLTPLFAALAAWLTALVANEVPGAPKLDPGAVEGIMIAAFLGTVAIVAKWLHGRQLPYIAGLAPTSSQLDQLHGEMDRYLVEQQQLGLQIIVEKWLRENLPAMIGSQGAADIDTISAVVAKVTRNLLAGIPAESAIPPDPHPGTPTAA